MENHADHTHKYLVNPTGNIAWVKITSVSLLFSNTVSSCPSIPCTHNNVRISSENRNEILIASLSCCTLPPLPPPPKKKSSANNPEHGCWMDLTLISVLGWQVPGGLSVCFRRSCFKNSSICRLIMNADFACVCDLQGLPYVKQAINSLWKCIVVWSR